MASEITVSVGWHLWSETKPDAYKEFIYHANYHDGLPLVKIGMIDAYEEWEYGGFIAKPIIWCYVNDFTNILIGMIRAGEKSPNNTPDGWNKWDQIKPEPSRSIIAISFFWNSEFRLKHTASIGWIGKDGVFYSNDTSTQPYFWKYGDEFVENVIRDIDLSAIYDEYKQKLEWKK